LIPSTCKSHPPNGNSIGSPIIAQHFRVTNRQADTQTNKHTTLRATSVATGRIYAMHATRQSDVIHTYPRRVWRHFAY